jgi:hypothetical protein
LSPQARYKLGIVAVTGALVVAVVWWGSVRDGDGARRAVRDPAPRTAPEPSPAANDPGGNGRRHVDLSRLDPVLDEATATSLFAGLRSGLRQVWHPLALCVLKPDQRLTYPWPEHPNGKIEVATNNRGFRRDEDTLTEKRGPRVLFAGDSHTDGLVENAESFVTRLEELLEQRGRSVECLNAGVGGTGPHHYLGTLRANLDLSPDVFVAMVYAGNDFTDALFLADRFTGRRPVGPPPEDYFPPLEAAMRRWHTSLVGNSFNQAYRYKALPEEEALALFEVVAVCGEMATLCEERGIAFAVTVIPTKPEVDRDDEETIGQVLEALDLVEADLEVNTRLRTGLVAALRRKGLTVIDPTARLQASGTPLYWRKDHHLNVAGNALLAEVLAERLAPLLPDGG